MTVRFSPSERAAVETDLRALAGTTPIQDYVKSLFELEVDDLASLLFKTMQRALGAELDRARTGRRLRIVWLLWCERFEDEAALLAYLTGRWPPEEGPFRGTTGFFTEEIRRLLVAPQLN